MPDSHVKIFDTTLRDGEQSPGATMTSTEKLEVARMLARMGVDVIEAGFPAASADDLEAVRAIANEIGKGETTICGLARAAKKDLDAAWEAVRGAKKPRIHTFLATSDLHLQHKLRVSRDEAAARVTEMVGYARSLCPDVEFSPEDATRSDPRYLHDVLRLAVAAGATTLNIPDTVGYTTPDEYGPLIAGIRAAVPAHVTISVHCHDDLGLATANTLAGIAAGARQAEVTVNGIGERAGNCALEEVVMALATRRPRYGLGTSIDTSKLCQASRLVTSCTGMVVQPNKAVVGANAFAHESGIHQDGMLKHEQTYEIMRPESVGATVTRLVLGKHSGRAGLAARLGELGYTPSAAELDEVFARFKTLADRKKQVHDADLESLMNAGLDADGPFALAGLQVSSGTMGVPTATVRVRGPNGETVRAAVGSGPIDAACKAIDEATGVPATLLEFVVHAVTPGLDALGEVSVRVAGDGGRVVHGRGADTDIIVASAKAYLAAVGRLASGARGRAHENAV